MAIKAKSYKKKIIILLDILGIKDFTLNNPEEKIIDIYDKIENLSKFDIAKMLQHSYSEPYGNSNMPDTSMLLEKAKLDVSISILSDTIIISFSKKYIFLLPDFLWVTRVLNIYLLKHGLLTRGSVVYEKICQSEAGNIIFGKGLVKAAIMEMTNSLPAIQICPKVEKIYCDETKPERLKRILESLQQDGIATGNIEVLSLITHHIGSKAFFENEGNLYYNHFVDVKDTLKYNNALKKVIKKPKKYKTYIDYYRWIIDDNLSLHTGNFEKCKNEDNNKKLERIVLRWDFTKSLFEKNVK